MQSTAARNCVRGHPLIGDGLFCQSCGAFQLDSEGTVTMAGRGERLLSWFVNTLLVILTLVIGWIIWWFIVAPKGQNPGKAIVGLRVSEDVETVGLDLTEHGEEGYHAS